MKGKIVENYRLLVHGRLYQIRKGFEECVNSLPVSVTLSYADLNAEGILSKLRFAPHMIVVLLNEGDSDFILPQKIKLFAPSVPLLVILPKVPESYHMYLKEKGVDEILQLPAEKENICEKIINMLKM